MAWEDPVSSSTRAPAIWTWIRDRIWATLDSPSTVRTTPAFDVRVSVDESVVNLVNERLRDELASEVERRRAVESKLVAVGSVAPIVVTILAAVVTFLTSGRATDFTAISVVIVAVGACYVALQFLRAMLAAITGLSRMSYSAPKISAILSAENATVRSYLSLAAEDMARRIEQYRDTTNGKVSQLAVAHVSVVNAVVALIFVIVTLAFITIAESIG